VTIGIEGKQDMNSAMVAICDNNYEEKTDSANEAIGTDDTRGEELVLVLTAGVNEDTRLQKCEPSVSATLRKKIRSV
jgi:hypothetical protein